MKVIVFDFVAYGENLAHLREGRFGRDDVLVFVHTGGTPANFTWSDLWLDDTMAGKGDA